LKRGLAAFNHIQVRLIVDALWISSNEEREIILSALKNILSSSDGIDANGFPFIIAVGLGGMENHQQIEGQKFFFDEVRKLGLKIDIHSGEGGDPEIHRQSIEQLNPDRVAHGFAAWSSHDYIAGNVVMCPLSNILLNTFSGLAHQHPLFQCLERGFPVAVGSDDPLLLGTTLALEYTFIHAVTGKGHEIFISTQENARSNALNPAALRLAGL
jgi:adenosine deaminase